MKAEDILKLVSDETGISIEDICLPDYIPGSSKAEVVAARKLTTVLLSKYATRPVYDKKLTQAEIGNIINRNRSMVSIVVMEGEYYLETNSHYRRKFDEIENKLKSLFIK